MFVCMCVYNSIECVAKELEMSANIKRRVIK